MGTATELSRRRFVGYASAAALAALPARSMADAKMQKRGNQMTTLTPYLLFDGKCQQAMEFYKSCFGGDLAATKVKDSPAKVVNARLRNDPLRIPKTSALSPFRPVPRVRIPLNLVGPTTADIRDVMVQGGGAGSAIMEICGKEERPVYENVARNAAKKLWWKRHGTAWRKSRSNASARMKPHGKR